MKTMNTEQWRPVDGWEKYYKVSNTGRVVSLERTVTRRGILHAIKERELSGCVTKGWYPRVMLRAEGRTKWTLIHRLVANSFIENPLRKPEVNHKDGNKINNHADNLEWVTSSENSMHAHAVLGAPNPPRLVGNQNPSSKLTETQVAKIRAWYKTGNHTLRSLALIMNVSKDAILLIVKNKTWRHVICLFALVSFVPLFAGIDERILLDAIAVREASPDGAIGKNQEQGVFQMMPKTVADSGGHDRAAALRHMRWLQANLRKLGLAVNPFNIALCWNAGLQRATTGAAKVVSYQYAMDVDRLYLDRVSRSQNLAAERSGTLPYSRRFVLAR